MTTANRVWETSTTTGTGNLTLAGAVSNYQTFNGSRGTSRRFTYFIDNEAGLWETGVGYLSASTTLVRESVSGNSSGTTSAISFTGTLQVFIPPAAENIIQQSTGFSSKAAKSIIPANAINAATTDVLTADQILYHPFYILRPVLVDTAGVAVTTGAGSAPPTNEIICGLYDNDPNIGEPGFLQFSVTGLDPSSTGVVSGTFTEIELTPGLYWGAIWSDAAPTLRAANGSNVMPISTCIASATSLNPCLIMTVNGQTSLSDLPATGNPSTAVTGTSAWAFMFLGHS